MRENAGHSHSRHLLHVVPPDHLPLVRQQRIEPRVVRPITDSIVVEVRHGLVQVVQYLRFPVDVGIEDILRQLESHRHRVAVVVVRDVVSPIKERRRRLSGMGHVPAEQVDLAIATIYLHDGSDERDQVVANVLDVGALVDGQPIGQLHQRGWCARFR